MTTIIFSDTHLTRGFEKRKFNYLKKIITSADKVIINGDFWDGYFTDFDKFVKSKWSRLFPLLKSRQTIYIYGNHDKKQWCDERVNLFSQYQAESLKLNNFVHTLWIEHGNRINPKIDDLFPWIVSRKTRRRIISILVFLFGRIFHMIGGKSYHEISNKKIKSWWIKQETNNQILVCGHSHAAELNLSLNYINTGSIRYGHAHYLRITDNKLELVEERYHWFASFRQASRRFSNRQATFTGPTPPGTGV